MVFSARNGRLAMNLGCSGSWQSRGGNGRCQRFYKDRAACLRRALSLRERSRGYSFVRWRSKGQRGRERRDNECGRYKIR